MLITKKLLTHEASYKSSASAAKLRSGGPILPFGLKPRGVSRDSATSNRYRRPVTCGQGRNCRGAFSVLRSLCRTQNDAVRDNALPHERDNLYRGLPSWVSRTSGTIFTAALSSVRTAGP